VVAGVARLATAGRIAHRARVFRKVDVRRCVLVIAATGVDAVDDAVADTARRHRALVNAVDRPARCDFIYGSVLRRGELQIAVSTGGRAPARARAIRRRLEPVIGAEYAALVADVGRARRAARAAASTPPARLAAGERVVAAALRALEQFAVEASLALPRHPRPTPGGTTLEVNARRNDD